MDVSLLHSSLTTVNHMNVWLLVRNSSISFMQGTVSKDGDVTIFTLYVDFVRGFY